jgi:hypothetical protein
VQQRYGIGGEGVYRLRSGSKEADDEEDCAAYFHALKTDD